MTSKVCCEETKVDKTVELNDRDYLIDILSSEKALTKDMSIALTEASNRDLLDEYFEFFEITQALQADAYELAWNNGWYVLENAEKTKINKKVTELTKKLEELEN